MAMTSMIQNRMDQPIAGSIAIDLLRFGRATGPARHSRWFARGRLGE